MSTSTKPLVLITGATGFVGFRTLQHALAEGYLVRAAVRNEAKAESIQTNPAIAALNLAPGQLTFTYVPDFLAANAFDEAVRDVTYILHLASPIPRPVPDGEDPKTWFIGPAVRGTLAVLEAAQKTSSVQRVVVTSSTVAVLPAENFKDQAAPYVPNNSSRTTVPEGETATDPETLYRISKVASLNEAEAWVAREKPRFDVVHLMPSYVLGRSGIASKPEDLIDGSNATVMTIATGKDFGEHRRVPSVVHVDDVARIHVAAVDRERVKGKSYMLNVLGLWEDVPRIVQRDFPQAVESGIVKTTGRQTSLPLLVDVGETEQTFGKLKSFEDMVKDLVGQYVELKQKA